MLWATIVIATLCVQATNALAMTVFGREPAWTAALTVGVVSVPLSILSTVCYAYYYGRGGQEVSYVALSVTAYGVSLVCTLAIQWIFNNRPLSLADALAAGLVLLGLAVHVFRDSLFG